MISLKQFTGSQVVAKDDAILYDWLSQNAVSLFFGCEVTSLGANMMRITSGRGIILGRTFEVQQEDFAAQLATPGNSWKGRVYVEIDTSNTAQPIAIKTVAAESLAPLVQEDINGDGTIYQFELYTYDASPTEATNLARTAKTIDSILPSARDLAVIETEVIESIPTGLYYYKQNTAAAPNTQDGLLLALVYAPFGAHLAFPTNGGIYFRWAVNNFSKWVRLDQ